jgi:hypothetical protein
MTIPPDHGAPPPGSPPPSQPYGSPPPPPPPARGGMSTAAKVLIGCAVAAVVVVVLFAAVLGGGAWFLNRQLADADAGIGRQVEVTRQLNELEESVDFRPPADGVVAAERATRFFRVTDAVWEETREMGDDIFRRSDQAERRGRATFGDGLAAMRGLGRARVSMATHLESQRMPPSEYVWTGLALLRAHEHAGEPSAQSGVPEQNAALARQYADRLQEIARGDDDERLTRGHVFNMAYTFILSEEMGRRFSGFDTLNTSAP